MARVDIRIELGSECYPTELDERITTRDEKANIETRAWHEVASKNTALCLDSHARHLLILQIPLHPFMLFDPSSYVSRRLNLTVGLATVNPI